MMQPAEVEKFVRLLASSEHEVYRYIYALVPDPNNAQDIFQETAVALWRNFEKYDHARPFTPWACRFAYHEVLNFRKRYRHAPQWLSDDLIDRLAEDRRTHAAQLDERREALSRCVAKLPDEARELLDLRYGNGLTVQEIARRTGRSVHTMYKAIDRVRRWLQACIDRSTAEGPP